MLLMSELHQVLTHLSHTRAAVDFEPVPACPLPNWAMGPALCQKLFQMMEDRDSHDREDDHFTIYPNLVQFSPIYQYYWHMHMSFIQLGLNFTGNPIELLQAISLVTGTFLSCFL